LGTIGIKTKLSGALALAGAAVALGLAAVAASHAAIPGGSGVLKVRLGGDSAQTRIVIDIDRSVTGKLEDDGAGGKASVMLSGVSAEAQQGAGLGLVRHWALTGGALGARLDLDLGKGAHVTRRFLLPPADGIDHYRYVVDVAASGPHAAAPPPTAAPVPPPAPAVQPTKVLRTQFIAAKPPAMALQKVIVIDAGHGGHDPGARGAEGLEKDVNLAAARALKARLEASGHYKVVMTRDDDVYVPLDQRVRVAQRSGADLFISLHSDSGTGAALRGASVYTLSDKASLRAAKFVSGDDWLMKASMTGGRSVSDILFDLTQRATKNRSAAFAETLIDHIDGKAPLLRRSHRDAGFMVLLAPEVPAVLLEMGFVSNPQDEAFLRDADRRGRMMAAVADSIDDYFGQTTKLASR
jgi:N-acetylmuramoyl-L-alanine amidase